MSQADIVVLPSYSEMCPVILLEAMTLKKAIVATNVGGIPEMIKDGFNGLLVEPRNEEELGGVLLKLITDSTLRYRLGSNALRFIRERYDVSVVAPKFLQFMEEEG
jgi:glycosyltransferase involved in cell wall biosynthesis